MRFPLVPSIVLLLFNGFIDYCIYRNLVRHGHNKWLARVQAVSAIFFALVLIVTICMPKRSGSDHELIWAMWGIYAYFSVYLPKYIYLIFSLLSKVPKIWHSKPWSVVSKIGALVGVIIFVLMWWGALINRYNIQVVDVDVPIADLPVSFDGLTIAQISDLHVGTYYEDTTFVSKLVDSVNALRPDVIVFTGDMVNRQSDEFIPFVTVMSRLHAPMGVYSILGNHDYGDYKVWSSPEAKEADVRTLVRMEEEAGMKMLNNEHVWLRAANDSIALIGVENIGDPPFTVYGDLAKAYPTIEDSNVKILLSHNPAHWVNDIKDSDKRIDLTLAGHTHAMQIELFGLSPASWRYKTWGGLYEDNNKYLYVNIGAGTVGIPTRIGATPEITLLKLCAK